MDKTPVIPPSGELVPEGGPRAEQGRQPAHEQRQPFVWRHRLTSVIGITPAGCFRSP